MASPTETLESTCPPDAEAISASLRSYRGHLSRAINSSARATSEYMDSQDSASLTEKRKNIRKHFERIENLTFALQNIDPNNAPRYDADLVKDEERSDKAIHVISKAMKAIVATSTDSQRNPGRGTPSRRINDSLKPALLPKDASPIEMRHWLESFRSYYASNDMDSLPERQSYFRILLDVDLRTRISAKMDGETNVLGPGGCLQLVEDDFLARYPLLARRLDFLMSAKTIAKPAANARRPLGTSSRRINKSLKPAILPKDASPIETCQWIESFRSEDDDHDAPRSSAILLSSAAISCTSRSAPFLPPTTTPTPPGPNPPPAEAPLPPPALRSSAILDGKHEDDSPPLETLPPASRSAPFLPPTTTPTTSCSAVTILRSSNGDIDAPRSSAILDGGHEDDSPPLETLPPASRSAPFLLPTPTPPGPIPPPAETLPPSTRMNVLIQDGRSDSSFEFLCLADTGSETTLVSEDLVSRHNFANFPNNDISLMAANHSIPPPAETLPPSNTITSGAATTVSADKDAF
ncbi:Hypothetical predicted protein, partial [Paramuricea clavata]